MLQSKVLRELSLAAGLWLTASAAMAAPQPGQDMLQGPGAMPPKAYVEFCERKPQDCGADPQLVLAGAHHAETDRAELMAQLGVAMPAAVMPAAVSGTLAPVARPAVWIPPPAALEPPEAPLSVAIEPAEVLVRVDFVDLSAVALQEAEARAPHMTPRLWSLLNQVNGQVNGAIEQRTDIANYGVDDYWSTPLEDGRHSGDCEDYVLEKERALIAAGVSRRALNIAVVTTRWGESHAVLLVATSEGEYVLDNLSPWIVRWREAPYRWLRRQVDGEAFNWVMVEERDGSATPAAKGLLIASNR